MSPRISLFFLTSIIITTYTQVVPTITTSSPLVGSTSNYTISLTNQTDITRVDFTFATWTDSNPQPYSSSSQLLFSDLIITPVLFPSQMICNLGKTINASTFQFTLTNIRNPASTKPYPISVMIYNSNGATTTYSGSLTVTTINNNTFPYIGYDTTIAVTSNNVELYLSPLYALQMSNNTFLEITYDQSLVPITVGTNSIYTLLTSTAGRVVLGEFSSSSVSLLRVANVTIANPQAGITFTVNCRFYLLDAGVQYDM